MQLLLQRWGVKKLWQIINWDSISIYYGFTVATTSIFSGQKPWESKGWKLRLKVIDKLGKYGTPVFIYSTKQEYTGIIQTDHVDVNMNRARCLWIRRLAHTSYELEASDEINKWSKLIQLTICLELGAHRSKHTPAVPAGCVVLTEMSSEFRGKKRVCHSSALLMRVRQPRGSNEASHFLAGVSKSPETCAGFHSLLHLSLHSSQRSWHAWTGMKHSNKFVSCQLWITVR